MAAPDSQSRNLSSTEWLAEVSKAREEQWRKVTPSKFLNWFAKTRDEGEARRFFADWLTGADVHGRCVIYPILAYCGYLSDATCDALRAALRGQPPAVQVNLLRERWERREGLEGRLKTSGDLGKVEDWPSLGQLQEEFYRYLIEQARSVQTRLSVAWKQAHQDKQPPTSIESLLGWARRHPDRLATSKSEASVVLEWYDLLAHLFFKCPDYNVRTAFADPHIIAQQIGEGVGDRRFQTGDERLLWHEVRTGLACLWPDRSDNPLKEALTRQLVKGRYRVAWNLLLEVLGASLPEGEDSAVRKFDGARWHDRVAELIPNANSPAEKQDQKDLFCVCRCLGVHADLRNALLRLAFYNREGLRLALQEFLCVTEPGTRPVTRLREQDIAVSYAAAKASENPPVNAVARTVYERTGREADYPVGTEDKTIDKRIGRDLDNLNVRPKRRSR